VNNYEEEKLVVGIIRNNTSNEGWSKKRQRNSGKKIRSNLGSDTMWKKEFSSS
jgi:hypothetical protein